jgi:hypothetical protein
VVSGNARAVVPVAKAGSTVSAVVLAAIAACVRAHPPRNRTDGMLGASRSTSRRSAV